MISSIKLCTSKLSAYVMLFLLLLLSTGTAQCEKIAMKGVFPAKFPEVAKLSRLALRPFAGTGGMRFGSALEAALNLADINNAAYFTLVGNAGNNKTGAVDGIVDGAVSVIPSEQRFTQQTTECVAYSGQKCVQSSARDIRCILEVVSVVFDTRVTKSSDGTIVYSSSKPLRDQFSWCEGQVPGKGVNDSVTELAQQAAEQIRQEISPYSQDYTVRVFEATQGLSKANVREFKNIIRLSEHDAAGSCTAWVKMAEEEKSSGALAFNLGICAERVSDYATATANYRTAQSLFPDGKREISDAITRVGQLAQAHQQVEQQIAIRETTRRQYAQPSRRVHLNKKRY